MEAAIILFKSGFLVAIFVKQVMHCRAQESSFNKKLQFLALFVFKCCFLSGLISRRLSYNKLRFGELFRVDLF